MSSQSTPNDCHDEENLKTNPTDNDVNSDNNTRRRSFCSCCFYHPYGFLTALVFLVVTGSILVWKVPQIYQRDSTRNDEILRPIDGAADDALIESVFISDTSATENTTVTIMSSVDVTLASMSSQFNRCSSPENCCNGVAETCDRRVSDVMFAGLHNAHSSVEDGFFFLGNHRYSLETALKAGFRAINLDLANCNGQLALVHGTCALGRRDPYAVFTHIQQFLDEHPRELLIIPIQVNNRADERVDLWEFGSILQSVPGLMDRVYSHDESKFWPTMRELIDSDQRILLFVYNADVVCRYPGDCPSGLHDWFLFATETKFQFRSVNDFADTSEACAFDRGTQGYQDFYAMNVFVSNPLPSRASARIINQHDFLSEHWQACQELVGKKASIIFIDFWEEGNLVDLVQSYNQKVTA